MHNTPEPFTQAEMFGWADKVRFALVVAIYAACILGPLYVALHQ